MSVVKARIQTVEEMYRLIWTAIENKRPIRAIYKDLPRLFCPHRLGRNRLGQPRVLCYQYGGESESGLGPVGSPDNWRCVVFEKLRQTTLVPQPAWWRQILMPRISRSVIRRRDIERSRRTGVGPSPFSR